MRVAKFNNAPLHGAISSNLAYGETIYVNVGGRLISINMTSKSGKIIYRNKIDTLIGIIHPGIVLGDDHFGITWVIHNHYKIGHPEIVMLNDFANGVDVLEDTRTLFYR